MRSTFASISVRKMAAVAAALVILPVAVACEPQADEAASDVPAEVETSDAEPDADAVAEDEAVAGDTIVDVASADGSFNTLVAAIQAADLVDTLSAEGPYTVFAPTDDAFAALPEGVLEALLLPENEEALTQVLTYHVVNGEIASSAVETGTVPTVEGSDLDAVAEDGSVSVNGVNVVTPDVDASNGVIHVIDAVLLPPTVDPAAL